MLSSFAYGTEIVHKAHSALQFVEGLKRILHYTDILQKRSLTAAEQIDYMAQACFLGLLGLDFRSPSKSQSNKRKFSEAVVVGTADVIRTATAKMARGSKWSKDDTVDLAGVAAYRLGRDGGVAADFLPERFRGTVQAGSQLCEATGLVIQDRDKVSECVSSIFSKIYNYFFPPQSNEDCFVLNENPLFIRWLKKQSHPDLSRFTCPLSGKILLNPIHHSQNRTVIIDKLAYRSARNQLLANVVIAGQTYPLAQFELKVDQALRSQALAFINHAETNFQIYLGLKYSRLRLDLRNPAAMSKIPSVLHAHPGFSVKCAITNKPIRFVVIPKDERIMDVYYEKNTLRRWISERPRQRPPLWPENLPFQTKNISECPRIQRQIDGVLEQIAAEVLHNNN